MIQWGETLAHKGLLDKKGEKDPCNKQVSD